uniref:Uncharacterized protein n=1 Tax=Pararge aegeria TaxID=116150 RepID=S4PDG6_9NEOP
MSIWLSLEVLYIRISTNVHTASGILKMIQVCCYPILFISVEIKSMNCKWQELFEYLLLLLHIFYYSLTALFDRKILDVL